MAGFEFGYGDLQDDDGDEEASNFQLQYGTKDGLIFLIDCSQAMFELSDERCPFEICIKCAKTTLQNKIVGSDKDLVGVVFFGTEKSNGDFKNIYIYQDLDQPGAQRILDLEAMMENGVQKFKKDYGHSQSFSLSQALWTCSNMFSKTSQKIHFKRVMIFTNNDDPHADDQQLQRQAITKANDLSENGIDLELMHMHSTDGTFDFKKFYKELIFTADDDLTELPDPAERLDDLLTRVRAKDHKKRALGRVPFSLAEGVNLSVGIYNMVGKCPKPYPVKLLKKTNEELKTKTETVIKETGDELGPDELKKAQTYGGRQICFETDEVANIKYFDSPGLMLMGFKPVAKVKRYHHVKAAQFLYPDEKSITGSTTLFTALLKKCIDRDVVPICRYIPRKNTPPRFVALMPQEEEVDEHNVQTAPPGFHVITLPFADDFRQIPVNEAAKANTEQINKGKELVKKFKFDYSPESFENPVLQQYWINIEALALDRDEPDEFVDYTLPDGEKMERRAGNLISDFKDLVFPVGYTPGAKRKAPASGAGPAKRTKPEEPINIDMKEEWKAGRLGKLTVAVLKQFVKQQDIKTVATKKADIITAIDEYFSF